MKLVRFILVFISLALAYNLAFAAGSSAVPLDKVVAIVNNNVITQSQLDAAMNDMKVAVQMSGQPVDVAVLKKKALDQLILQKLQLDVAARNKMVISDKELSDAIGRIAAQNHLTIDQLKTAVTQQGISYNRFRAQIHDQMLIHGLQQRLFGANIAVSDKEVQDFLKKTPNQPTANTQYYVDDLLISLDDSATPADIAAAQKTAQAFLTQAQQGKSFADIASNAASSAKVAHTDLGWRRMNDLPSVFAQEVATMQPNSVKGPIRAPNGWHLLKVLTIRGGSEPMTAIQAKNILFQQKIQGQIDVWQRQIQKSAYIKIMTP